MRFNGALSDIQIPSNFCIVTPLQKQIDDLSFPGSHLVEFLFHGYLR
jgi:hypothetical protein